MTGQRITNQKSAQAGRDIIAGDQVVHHHHAPTPKATVVERLLEKLHEELNNNSQVTTMISELQYYYKRKPHDHVYGLEDKLKMARRDGEIHFAIEKKELFAKTLERWSMYASAQEIFAHLLARAEVEYRTNVFPQLDSLTDIQFNDAISTRIITPIVDDCGASVFKLNHGTAMGMLYWLAEQCFVRWHK